MMVSPIPGKVPFLPSRELVVGYNSGVEWVSIDLCSGLYNVV